MKISEIFGRLLIFLIEIRKLIRKILQFIHEIRLLLIDINKNNEI